MDAFLDTLTPEQFDELVAYDLVEGIGGERLARTIELGFAYILTALSGKKVKPDQLFPRWKKRRRKPADYESNAQQEIANIRAALSRGM